MEEIALIRNHIKGMLTEEEGRKVEERLKSDAEFKALYKEQQSVMQGISLAERDRLKGVLQEEGKSKFNYWYAVAAMVPLLIGAYFMLWAPSDSSYLFEYHYEPYGVYEFGEVRGADNVDSREIEAFRMYSNGEYENAENAISELMETQEKEGYHLYLAISRIELGKFDSAMEALNEINDDSNYSSVSKWYKALIYLKTNRKSEAEVLLKELAEGKNGLAIKAQKLLDQL